MTTYTDEEFRVAAKRRHGEPGVSVLQYAAVQRCGSGAFVELTVWVPDDAVEVIRMEQEFNSGRSVHPTRL